MWFLIGRVCPTPLQGTRSVYSKPSWWARNEKKSEKEKEDKEEEKKSEKEKEDKEEEKKSEKEKKNKEEEKKKKKSQ